MNIATWLIAVAVALAAAAIAYLSRHRRPPGDDARSREPDQPLELGAPETATLARALCSEVKVFYATDRAEVPVPGRQVDFGADRGPGLSFGYAKVTVPRTHRRGCIERPSWLRLEFSEDPRRHMVVQEVVTFAERAFVDRLGEALDQQSSREAFLFVHGFNVSFNHACLRVAQLAYDLQHFVPVLFSWPSRGHIADYVADSTAVQWCRPHLSHVVNLLLGHARLQRLHVIGHSMGTQAVAAVVRDLVGNDRVREIVLAAADIDRQLFEEQIAPVLSSGRPRATVYASEVDQALQLSKSLNRGYSRLGDCEGGVPVLPGIDTIDATAVASSILNHSTVFDVRTMVEDLHRLLADGTPAERRNLVARDAAGRRYWSVAR